MFFLWILGIIVALILLKYAYLMLKRMSLIRKIRKNADEIRFLRNRFRSVFKKDGKPDFVVKKGDRCISVSVLTTPFRKVRYHFDNNEKAEIYWERRGMFVMNPRAPGNNASIDRSFRIRKYRIHFDTGSDTTHYVILHPAPMDITRTSGAHRDALGNNDILFENIRICGLKYFLKNILPES